MKSSTRFLHRNFKQRRIGKANRIFGVILLLLILPVQAIAATFSDIPVSHPDHIAIEALAKAGIFKGYEDGTFKPDRDVNRAEALKIVSISGGMTSGTGLYSTGFSDVPLDAWYAGYVMEGVSRGIISGNPDGTFAGERGVNTSEFLKMILLTFKTDLSKHKNISGVISADVSAGMWYTPYLSYSKTIGLIFPDMAYRLYPGKLLTRAECARVLYKMLVINQGGETQKMLSIAEARLIEAMVMQNLNNLSAAIKYIDEAVYYANLANAASPESTAVQSVHKISLAFQKLFYAFNAVAGSSQTREEITSMISQAEKLANEAVAINSTSAWLAEKIRGYAANLRSQM